MANALRLYLDQGHSEEEVADALARKLNKKISVPVIRIWAGKPKPPEAWAEALGLPASTVDAAVPTPPAADGPPPRGAPGDGESPREKETRQTETPPRPLSDSPVAPTPALLQQMAKERIAALHVFAGAGLATAVDATGFEADRGVGGGIGKLWTDKADDLAAGWIAWADEGNKFAAAFVRLMATGGAGGTLVMGYAMLVGGTAYIMGQMPDNEVTRVPYGRYAKYRPADVPAAEQEGGGVDAAARPSPVRAVGDATRAAGS